MTIKVAAVIILLLMGAPAVAGFMDADRRQMISLSYLRPIILKESATSVTQLLREFGQAAGFAPHDIQMMEMAAQTPSRDEVTSWVGTSQQRLTDDKLEIARDVVSREFLKRSRPGKEKFIMKPDFHGHFLELIRATQSYGTSSAGKVEAVVPPDLLALLHKAYAGEKLEAHQLQLLEEWAIENSNPSDLKTVGPALYVAYIALLDQQEQVSQALEKAVPWILRLQGHLLCSRDDSEHVVYKMFREGFETEDACEMLTSQLLNWRSDLQKRRVAEEILYKGKDNLTLFQKAVLLYILRDEEGSSEKDSLLDDVLTLTEAAGLQCK